MGFIGFHQKNQYIHLGIPERRIETKWESLFKEIMAQFPTSWKEMNIQVHGTKVKVKSLDSQHQRHLGT